jgi:hypothetical protein
MSVVSAEVSQEPCIEVGTKPASGVVRTLDQLNVLEDRASATPTITINYPRKGPRYFPTLEKTGGKVLGDGSICTAPSVDVLRIIQSGSSPKSNLVITCKGVIDGVAEVSVQNPHPPDRIEDWRKQHDTILKEIYDWMATSYPPLASTLYVEERINKFELEKFCKIKKEWDDRMASTPELLGKSVDASIKANLGEVLKILLTNDEQFRNEIADIIKSR